MHAVRSLTLFLLIAAVAASLAQAVPPATARPMDPVDEDPNLPRVLLIGDSISIGYTVPVRKKLLGRANVIRPRTNCAHTRYGLEQLDAWLGEKPWDVIHFNWGLHDLKYIDDKNKLAAVDKGTIQIPIEEYEANLDKLVERLKQTEAKLIWRNTTPVPDGSQGRLPADAARYNEAAARVMKKHGVETHDLYGFVQPQADKLMLKANVHFTPAGSDKLADDVVRVILPHLPQQPADTPADEATDEATDDGADADACDEPESGDEPPAGKATRRDIEYKQIGDVKLQLHGFFPAGWRAADQRPAIVFFFGGGWVGGTPSQFYPHAEHLAARGMVAFSAEYRVRSRHGTSPFECVADGKSAVRYLRAHAAELGIDPDRIVAAGGSAGGHVAACTGTVEGFDEKNEDAAVSSRPNAMALFNPVADTSELGYGNSRLGERWKEISPRHHVNKQTPPTIIFHGAKDTTVPLSNVEGFAKAMKEHENRCVLHVYEGAGHGFFNQGRGDAYPKTLVQLDAFLKSLGYLE